MKKLVVVLLFIGLTLPVIAQQRAMSADVTRVVSCIKSLTCKNVILTKGNFGNGKQIVFTDSHRRYTMYWSGEDGPQGFLSVWVRPEGTGGQLALITFTDRGLDGLVDFGVQGPASWSDSRRKHFHKNDEASPNIGFEFRQFWQMQLDEAIAAARRQLF